MTTQIKWEYAGFRYILTQDDNGRLIATPEPGQHLAAGRDKHRRAAVETYKQDHGQK